MKEYVYLLKELIKVTGHIVMIPVFIIFFECFWALLYTIKSFWTWGYILEEIGLLCTVAVVACVLVGIIAAYYVWYKESTENAVE